MVKFLNFFKATCVNNQIEKYFYIQSHFQDKIKKNMFTTSNSNQSHIENN